MSTVINETIGEGFFDELELIIEPTETGRTIVPVDPSLKQNVSKDGQSYKDETWSVKLFDQKVAYSHGKRAMVMMTYRGKAAWSVCSSTRTTLAAGELKISMNNRLTSGPVLKVSRIVYSCNHYADQLKSDFGILDSYVYESPNQTWDWGTLAPTKSYTKMYVFSDGEVVMYGDDRRFEEPTLEEMIRCADKRDLQYEVTGATWTVVAYCKDDNAEATDEEPFSEITLYTEGWPMADVMKSMEEYLSHSELASFDDIVNLRPEVDDEVEG